MIETIEDPKGKKGLQVRLDPEWHRIIKVEAAKRGVSMKTWVIEAVREKVEGRPD